MTGSSIFLLVLTSYVTQHSDVMSLHLDCLMYRMGMVIVYLPHRGTVGIKWDTVHGTWDIISTNSNYYFFFFKILFIHLTDRDHK